MKLPPCKTPDGIDCPRRYIGCKAECKEWNEWLAIHEAEKEAQRKDKNNPADDFLIKQNMKLRRSWNSAAKRGYKRK